MEQIVKSTLVITVCIALSACAGMAQKATEDKPAEAPTNIPLLTAQGDDALRKGNLDDAQVKYALVLDKDPNNLQVMYRLGLIHKEQGNADVAARLFRQVLAQDENHQGSIEALGIVLLMQEHLVEAQRMLNKALVVRPTAWKVLNALGIVNDLQANHKEAQLKFQTALELSPRSAKIENNLGYSYYLDGQYGKAERHFQNAIRIDSNNVNAWSNLGLTYSRQERYGDAKAAFSKVVETHQAANNLGYLALLQDDEATAYREFQTAIELSPSYYATANQNIAALANNNSSQRRTGSSDGRDKVAGLQPVAYQPRMKVISSPTVTRQAKRQDFTAAQTQSSAAKSPPSTASVYNVAEIRQLQRFLTFLGFDTGKADGRIGNLTVNAIENFTASYQLNHSSKLDRNTRLAIARIALIKIQNDLSALGYDAGYADGEFGRRTVSAVKQFQRDNNLTANGRLSSLMLFTLDRIWRAKLDSQYSSEAAIASNNG